MPGTAKNWYFTKEELERTASRFDSFSAEEETALRREGATFINDVGKQMRVPQPTIATAVVFFQRFFVYKSFKNYNNKDIGTCCLFLAGKVEETPMKLKDMVIHGEFVRSRGRVKLSDDSKEFWERKEALAMNERLLLQTLSFDLSVDHPYKYLLSYIGVMQGDKKLAQTAWNFINDSLRTTLCLVYPPQVIAAAAILMASKMEKFELPATKDGKPWHCAFVDCGLDVLEDVQREINSLYVDNDKVPARKSRYESFADAQKEADRLSAEISTKIKERDHLIRRSGDAQKIASLRQAIPELRMEFSAVINELNLRATRPNMPEKEKSKRENVVNVLRERMKELERRERVEVVPGSKSPDTRAARPHAPRGIKRALAAAAEDETPQPSPGPPSVPSPALEAP